MLQFKRNSLSKKHIYGIALLLLLLLSIAGYLFYTSKTTTRPEIEKSFQSEARPTDKLNVEAAKNKEPGAEQTGTGAIDTSNTSASAAAFPTTQPNLTVEIIKTTQANNSLTIDTSVEPSSLGTCAIELTRYGQMTISRNVVLRQATSSAKCANAILDISSADKGQWTLTVKVTVGKNVATTTSQVDIE